MNQRRSHRKTRFAVAVALGIAVSMAGMVVFGQLGMATAADLGEKIVKSLCVQCHRIEGKPAPRRTRKALDLAARNEYGDAGWELAAFEMGELQIPRFIFKKGGLCPIGESGGAVGILHHVPVSGPDTALSKGGDHVI